jgi:hypothetical protein
LQKPSLHWHQPASHPETKIYFNICKSVWHFMGHICCCSLSVVSQGLVYPAWQWFHRAYISRSPVCRVIGFWLIV